MVNFADVLDAIEQSPAAQAVGGNRARGTAFETATKYFLTHDPAWIGQFTNVWMWNDAGNPLRRLGPDTGIDLVARGLDGELWSIQSKYYGPDAVLDKKDMATFFTASHRAGIRDGHYIIAHTGAGLTSTLAKEVESYGTTVLDTGAFSSEFVEWAEFLPGGGTSQKFDPREHQVAAIGDCLKGFETADRGKLIMACGTGKTLTSLRLAEQMRERRDNACPDMAGAPFRVLFLAPSIALVSQTFSYWTHQSRESMASFVVCSDSTANRQGDADEWSSTVLDIPFPTTTDPVTLRNNAAVGSQNDGLTVIFSTYQSIEATIIAQAQGMPEFDLVVCDEAHRTAGAADNRQKKSPFVLVHDASLVRARQRLYMTATPRVYADSAKAQASREDCTAYSMDDEDIFGPEFYRLRFGQAVQSGILSDCRVLVLAVPQSQAGELSTAFVETPTIRENLSRIDAQRNKSRKPDRDERAQQQRQAIERQAQSFAGKIVGTWNGLLTRGVHNEIIREMAIDTGLGEQVQFSMMKESSWTQANYPSSSLPPSLPLSLCR